MKFGVADFDSIKAYVDFRPEHAERLLALYPLAAPRVPEIMDDFYETIRRHPEARAVITGGDEQISRLKRTLEAWLASVLQGPHDAEYLEHHSRIGRVHVRIGLPQQFMFTAMNRIRARLIDLVHQTMADDVDACVATVQAVDRILDLELAIMLDTYRERLNERVRSAERLATIGQLAASIGHELRNPLGIIESSLFLARQRLEKSGVDDPQVAKHHAKIERQVRLCTQTIEHLLDLARDREPVKSRVELLPLVQQVVSDYSSGTTVHIEVPEGLEVVADRQDVVHVVANLLANASQAQQGGGEVWIAAEARAGGVTLWVRDAGPGVPEEHRSRIFDALYTTKARGTGLGLALCRRIMAAHGGEIELAPVDAGPGARFRVWFPELTAPDRNAERS